MVDYSMYGFEENPFAREIHNVKMIDREEEWARLKVIAEEYLRSPSCTFTVVFGDYGFGKSFFLYKMEEAFTRNHEFAALPAPVLALRLKITEAQFREPYISDLFKRIVRRIGRERLLKMAKKGSTGLHELEPGLATVLAELPTDNGDSAWNWLVGRKVLTSDMRKLGVSFKVDDYGEIHTVFSDFLRFIRISGYCGIVLLLDELEYMLSIASEKQVKTLLHEYQRIWDSFNEMSQEERSKFASVLLVFASSPDAWQKFLEFAEKARDERGGGGTETFLRRIARDAMITLSPLRSKKQVRDLLVDRMQFYRKGTTPTDPLWPFKDDYLDFVRRVSWGIPSKIINYSALTLRESALSHTRSISASTAEKVLRNYNILIELKQTAGE